MEDLAIREVKKIKGGIDKVIKDAEQFDLSGSDILYITHNKTRLLPYEDLKLYDSLDQLFQPYGSFVLLYQTSQNVGHWVAIINRGNRLLEFYDPYGLAPDEELNINNQFHLRQHGGVITPHLTALIRRDNWRVKYNNKQLQRFLEDINTCGRYCALRIKFKDIEMSRFNDLLTKNDNYDPDFWVSVLTFLC
jgi:hypothetical protein